MRTLIIIPAYNEERNIVRVVENLMENFPQYDYVIINDGSKDRTGEICLERGYNVVNLPANLGIGGGVQTGYKYAKRHGYDIAVQIDGDGQHNPAYIEDGIRALEENGWGGMAIGSRFLIENEGFQSSFLRRVGIKFLSALIKLSCGTKVYDVTSGFRICDRALIELFAEHYAQDYPEPEAIINASLHGFKVVEFPVEMEERKEGRSSISFIKSIYYMIKVTIAIALYRFIS